MSEIQTVVNSLLVRSANDDPVMTTVFQEITDELQRLAVAIDPPPFAPFKINAVRAAAPYAVNQITARTTGRNVILEWVPADETNTFFEIRKGTDWNTADKILVTAERRAILDPVLVGTHTYLIKTLSTYGIYSDDTRTATITIGPIGPVTITSVTIAQNVLLYWTAPTSVFDIKEYIVDKNGAEVGRVTGTFAALTELVKGIYRYGVTPIDIAGNVGPTGLYGVDVTGPDDFVLYHEFNGNLSGTKVNAILISSKNILLLPVNLTETWRQHYVNNTWDQPSDQISADYPFYAEPTPSTASYKEVFDMGAIYTSSIISTSWEAIILDGSFNIGVSTRVSDDGITWGSPQTGVNVFVTSVRYIETTINFTALDARSLMQFFNLHVSLSVKETIDSGEVNAISTDVNGTVVAFHIAFRDVTSITLGVKTTTEQFIPIYRFNDVPNPTSFSVFVYDTGGIRTSKTISWKARGIV